METNNNNNELKNSSADDIINTKCNNTTNGTTNKVESNDTNIVYDEGNIDSSNINTNNSMNGSNYINNNLLNQHQVTQNLPWSAMAITSIVLESVAFLSTATPSLCFLSFLLWLLGVIFGIIGLVAIIKKKKRNNALLVVSIVLSTITMITVLCSIGSYNSQNGKQENNTKSETKSTQNYDSSSTQEKKQHVVGETVHLTNGLDLCVLEAQPGFVNYDGTPVVQVTVSYVNNSKSVLSFNPYDWMAEDPQGALTDHYYYTKEDESAKLNSGKLSPGGSKTGIIYFKGTVCKIHYNTSWLNNTSVTWLVR